MEKSHKILESFAALIGVVATFMLLIGFEFRLGYIVGFGLDPDYFDDGLAGVVAESWLMAVTVLVGFLNNFIWLAVCSVLYFFIIYLIVFLSRGFSLEYHLDGPVDAAASGVNELGASVNDPNEKPSQNSHESQSFLSVPRWKWNRAHSIVVPVALYTCVIFVLLVFSLVFLVTPFDYGKRSANESIEDFKQEDCALLESKKCTFLIEIKSEKVIASGEVVMASGDRIAFYDGKTVTVWPLLDSYKVQLKKKE